MALRLTTLFTCVNVCRQPSTGIVIARPAQQGDREQVVMDTVSIRDLRGAYLQEKARQGKALVITNHRVVIGVIVPVAQAWVQHIVERNWSRIRESIGQGEPIAATSQSAISSANATERVAHEPEAGARPLQAGSVGGTVVPGPGSTEAIEQLRAAFSGPQAPLAPSPKDAALALQTVRVGDLSARSIEQAGVTGRVLALTHNRELIGIVIPVTPSLVQFLIEENLPRVLDSIALGEKELTTGDPLSALDEVIPPPAQPS